METVRNQMGMNFDDLIARLRALQGPDPTMDKVLDQLLIWKQNYAKFDADGNGDEERVRWLSPKSTEGGACAPYTGSIQQAYSFARQIAPKERGGVSWEAGSASAVIGSKDAVGAQTAPIALIIAALGNLEERLAKAGPA
jgi:hypothetical protein